MATWVRAGTGSSPSILDSGNPLIGSVALDNATAPGDFDPGAVNSVRIEFTFRTAGGPAAGDTWNDQRRADLSTGGGDAANVSTSAVGRTTIGDFATDLTDSSPNLGLSTAQWEGATLDPTTSDPGWADISKNMGWDGVTLSIPVSLVTVTIDYEPDLANHYDETGLSVAITSSVSATDQWDAVDDVTVAIVATVDITDDYTRLPIDFDETGLVVNIVATVDSTDTHNVPTNYDETGLTVAITATVDSTDIYTSGLPYSPYIIQVKGFQSHYQGVEDPVITLDATPKEGNILLYMYLGGGNWGADAVLPTGFTEIVNDSGIDPPFYGQWLAYKIAEHDDEGPHTVDMNNDEGLAWLMELDSRYISEADLTAIEWSQRTASVNNVAYVDFDNETFDNEIPALLIEMVGMRTAIDTGDNAQDVTNDGSGSSVHTRLDNLSVDSNDGANSTNAYTVALFASLYEGDPDYDPGRFEWQDAWNNTYGYGHGPIFRIPIRFIQIVQEASDSSSGGDLTPSVDLGSVPVPGNLLMLGVTSGSSGYPISAPVGFVPFPDISGDYTGESNLITYYAKIAEQGDGTALGDYLKDGANQSGHSIVEFSSADGWPAIHDIVDVAKEDALDDAVSTKTSGTTAATSITHGLALALFRLRDLADTPSTNHAHTNGFEEISSVFTSGGSDLELTTAYKNLMALAAVEDTFTFDETADGVTAAVHVLKPSDEVQHLMVQASADDGFYYDNTGSDSQNLFLGDDGDQSNSFIRFTLEKSLVGARITSAHLHITIDAAGTPVETDVLFDAASDPSPPADYTALAAITRTKARSYWLIDSGGGTQVYTSPDVKLALQELIDAGNAVDAGDHIQLLVDATEHTNSDVVEMHAYDSTAYTGPRLVIGYTTDEQVIPILKGQYTEAQDNDGSGDVDVTLPNVPTEDWLSVIVMAGLNGDTINTPSGWTAELQEGTPGNYDSRAIFSRVNGASDSQTVTVNCEDVSDTVMISTYEFANHDGIDVVASASAQGDPSSVSSGTTAAALENGYAVVNGVGFYSASLQGGWDNHYTKTHEEEFNLIFDTYIYAGEKIGVAAGTQESLLEWQDTPTEGIGTIFVVAGPSSGTAYDETGRSVAITSVVTATDQLDMVENVTVPITSSVPAESQHHQHDEVTVAITSNVSATDDHYRYYAEPVTVAITSTVSATDQLDMALEALVVNITSNVTATDDQNLYYFEPVTVAITSTVSATDLVAGTDDVTVTITSSVTATDELTMTEALTVAITSTVDVTDDQNKKYVEPVTVAITSTVTVTDDHAFTENVTVAITSSVSTSDVQDMGEDVSVAITSVVTATDMLDAGESLTIPITSSVSATDDLTLTEDVTVAVSSAVTVTDAVAGVEALTVSITSTVSITEQLTLTEAVTVPITSTVDVSSQYDMLDVLVVAINSTVNITDALTQPGAYEEPVFVNINATVTASDVHTMVEALTVAVISGLSISDIHNMLEAGVVNISSVVSATDQANRLEGVTVAITSTVTATDDHNEIFYEDVTVPITSTVTAAHWVNWFEPVSVAITSSVGVTDDHILPNAYQEDVTVAVVASIGATDELDASEALNVAITATVDITDELTGPGSNFQEDVTVDIIGTVAVTDRQDMVNDPVVAIFATIAITDAASFPLEELTVAITATVTQLEQLTMGEAVTVNIVADVSITELAVVYENLLVEIISAVAITNTQQMIDILVVPITSTIESWDNWFMLVPGGAGLGEATSTTALGETLEDTDLNRVSGDAAL